MISTTLQPSYHGMDLGGGRRHARATARKRGAKDGDQVAKHRSFVRVARRFHATAEFQRAGPQAISTHGH
eukprot:6563935-Pyramimonas_sp.AAC.1